MPLIGEKTPSFKAETTQGPINFPEIFKGKWVVFFSHPVDFTPVCTMDFLTFATMEDLVAAFLRGVGHVNGHRNKMGFVFDHDGVHKRSA